jgi:hypothetical protein
MTCLMVGFRIKEEVDIEVGDRGEDIIQDSSMA